eukprot:TRINITY_DN3653_c0_g1_i1.p1 TRINITY_DN3653_c0_g1~~TRINITY_DN3653_c0_g1_i1.p1  ORF type:complete len:650 (+),score=68.70 TRINITY_DN3653_c0_g1_i1:167-1951(+)
MTLFTTSQAYSSAQQTQQQVYMTQQNYRVQSEYARSANMAPSANDYAPGGSPMAGGIPYTPGFEAMSDIPAPDKCIGQVVLDWEFLHDLDLHLMKVVLPGTRLSRTFGGSVEPNAEPPPTATQNLDLQDFILNDESGYHLKSDVVLDNIVSYTSKVYNPSRADVPEAVLQVDRNAAVHSLEPVENIYLTETLEPGAYVIGVHNYCLRQLADNVIGASAEHQYRTYDDFKKMNPGYQMMEKAMREQSAHANDPEGTPEKRAIMAQVNLEMNNGSWMITNMCYCGTAASGVHYGITLYSYPQAWPTDAKHPQMASGDELQNLFQSGFFATADFVFDPEANTTGYNGANVVADVNSAEGKLALSNGKAAYVALLKIAKDADSGKSKIAEVIMLSGQPRDGLGPTGVSMPPMTSYIGPDSQMPPMSSPMFQTMPPMSSPMSQTQRPQMYGYLPQPQPQPQPLQRHRTHVQQPFPQPRIHSSQMQTARIPVPYVHQAQMYQPFHQPMVQNPYESIRAPTQQPLPQAMTPSSQIQTARIPQQYTTRAPVQQPFPQPMAQRSQTQTVQMPVPYANRVPMQQPFPQPMQPGSIQRSSTTQLP